MVYPTNCTNMAVKSGVGPLSRQGNPGCNGRSGISLYIIKLCPPTRAGVLNGRCSAHPNRAQVRTRSPVLGRLPKSHVTGGDRSHDLQATSACTPCALTTRPRGNAGLRQMELEPATLGSAVVYPTNCTKHGCKEWRRPSLTTREPGDATGAAELPYISLQRGFEDLLHSEGLHRLCKSLAWSIVSLWLGASSVFGLEYHRSYKRAVLLLTWCCFRCSHVPMASQHHVTSVMMLHWCSISFLCSCTLRCCICTAVEPGVDRTCLNP